MTNQNPTRKTTGRVHPAIKRAYEREAARLAADELLNPSTVAAAMPANVARLAAEELFQAVRDREDAGESYTAALLRAAATALWSAGWEPTRRPTTDLRSEPVATDASAS